MVDLKEEILDVLEQTPNGRASDSTITAYLDKQLGPQAKWDEAKSEDIEASLNELIEEGEIEVIGEKGGMRRFRIKS